MKQRVHDCSVSWYNCGLAEIFREAHYQHSAYQVSIDVKDAHNSTQQGTTCTVRKNVSEEKQSSRDDRLSTTWSKDLHAQSLHIHYCLASEQNTYVPTCCPFIVFTCTHIYTHVVHTHRPCVHKHTHTDVMRKHTHTHMSCTHCAFNPRPGRGLAKLECTIYVCEWLNTQLFDDLWLIMTLLCQKQKPRSQGRLQHQPALWQFETQSGNSSSLWPIPQNFCSTLHLDSLSLN